MATYKIPEYRHIVEEMVEGKRRKNRFREPAEVGDTVQFFSARPVCLPPDALEDTPDANPISVVVHVSKVGAGPSDDYPYFIYWDMSFSSSGW